MPKDRRAASPVTVTQLPLTRCRLCRTPVAHRPGQAVDALTKHYERAHPETLQGNGGPPPK